MAENIPEFSVTETQGKGQIWDALRRSLHWTIICFCSSGRKILILTTHRICKRWSRTTVNVQMFKICYSKRCIDIGSPQRTTPHFKCTSPLFLPLSKVVLEVLVHGYTYEMWLKTYGKCGCRVPLTQRLTCKNIAKCLLLYSVDLTLRDFPIFPKSKIIMDT